MGTLPPILPPPPYASYEEWVEYHRAMTARHRHYMMCWAVLFAGVVLLVVLSVVVAIAMVIK